MAKKEIKKQTIEEILADHHQYPRRHRLHYLGNLRKIRAEEKRAQQCILRPKMNLTQEIL